MIRKVLFSALLSFLFFGVTRSANCQWVQTNIPAKDETECLLVKGTDLFAGTFDGIFRSSDNGMSWVRVSTGLTDPYVRALLESGGNLFAGTESAVYRSTDDGVSWASSS